MNTDDLLVAVRDLLKEVDAGQWSDAQLVRLINQAYGEVFGQQVLLFEDWTLKRGLISLVADTDEYDMPVDLKKLRMVEVLDDSEWYRIKQCNFVDRHRYDHRGVTAIYPSVFRFYLIANQIGLVPTPGTSITDGLRLSYQPVAGELHYGTAQDGAATTITLQSTASTHDDAYNDMTVHVIVGTGAGEKQVITDYVGSTKVATVEAWGTNPAADDTYAIVPKTRDAMSRVIPFLAAAFALHYIDKTGYTDMMVTYERRLKLAKGEVDQRSREPRYVRHIPRDLDLFGV